jgi:glycosyltransferase involved in cell wall biosynthesis
VRPGDVDELARAIMVLAEDPELRQAITDCASVYAAENYSLEKMNDKLEKIYLALAERS